MITTVQENLAKLMSAEDITVIQQPEKTAYFDTQKRVLVIPTWENLSDIIVELLIGHEIGHALYTNSDEWIAALKLREPNGVFRDYLNIIEDARIESLVKQRYPGMKKIFFHGYKQILENKIMVIDDVKNLSLIDRLNVYFKFNGIFSLSLSEREETYIRKIESVVNFKEVIDIAIEIFDSELHENRKRNNSSQKEESGEESTEDSTDEDSTEESTDESTEESTDESTEESTDDSGDTESGSARTSRKVDDDTQKESSTVTESTNTPSKSQTLRDLDNSLSDRVNTSVGKILYVDMPTPILGTIIYPFESIKKDFDRIFSTSPENKEIKEDSELDEIFGKTGNSLSSFYTEHKNNISLHKQLFQMRKKADQHNKTMMFRTGSLDMNKLYSYKYNDQIFKTFEVRPNGKNHGLIFIMDFSSSMSTYLHAAKTKALELILFCKQIGIPYVLYGFFDSVRQYEYDAQDCEVVFDTHIGKNEYTFETTDKFRLLELLSSRMSESNFKCMVDIFMNHIGNHMYGLGGTPLSETHLCLDSLVAKFREDCAAKIVNVVYFTDGQGPAKSVIYKNAKTYSYPSYRSKIVIHDPKTKQNHYCSEYNSGCSSEDFLKIIKTRMKDVTVINFLITSDLLYEITEDQRKKYLTEMGLTSEEIQNMRYSGYLRKKTHEAFNSKYIVIERVDKESFDTTFICSTEMFKKPKPHNSKEKTLSVAETFCKSASTQKRVNTMISKFIDLIV